MENVEDIISHINKTDNKISNLDNKINTDDELIAHSEEIRGIYDDICKIDKSIKNMDECEEKQDLKCRLFEIKRLFTDLMIDRVIDGDFEEIDDEGWFDSVNKDLVSDLECIINQKLNKDFIVGLNYINSNDFDNVDIPEINVQNIKDRIQDHGITFELIESINKKLTEEEKIILLKELSLECIKPEYISFLAAGLGFKTGILKTSGESGEIKIPYIDYGLGHIIVDDGELVYGEDYETAYTKYIVKNTQFIYDTLNHNAKIIFGTSEKTITYTIDTNNLEQMNKLTNDLHENIRNGKSPSVFEFVYKFGPFTKIELMGGTDSIKAELYNKLTIGGGYTNLGTVGGAYTNLGGGLGLSYTHKGNNVISTTSAGASTNLLTFSSKGPKWKPSCKFDITERLQFRNGLLFQGKIYTNIDKDTKKVNAEAVTGYKKGNTEFTGGIGTNGAVASVKYNIPPSRKRR